MPTPSSHDVDGSLAREIEYLIRAGATYIDAPTLGEEVLDQIDAFQPDSSATPITTATRKCCGWRTAG